MSKKNNQVSLSANGQSLNKKSRWKTFVGQLDLQLMTIPGIIFVIIFSYIPMVGIVIAFQDYNVGKGFFESSWVGLKHFEEMFSDPSFWESAKNTVLLSFYNIIFGFPAPILLALILNEVPSKGFKRWVQTGSYLPHFVSFVVVASMVASILDSKGLLNNILTTIGVLDKPIQFLAEPKYFRTIAVLINIWKGTGWGAIVYLAAISGISEELYEAAVIDGAGRMRRMVSITLPNLAGIITIMFILGISGLVRGSLDMSVLLGNPFNRNVSYVIEHYTLDMGLTLRRYSFSTAIGLVQSIFALSLVLITNWVSGKVGSNKLF